MTNKLIFIINNMSINESNEIKFWNPPSSVVIFLPLILGMFAGVLSPMKKNSGIKKYMNLFSCPRPPSYVFGLVWPILYILFGIAWNLTLNSYKSKSSVYDKNMYIMSIVFYSFALLCLIIWTKVYNSYKSKMPAMYLLIVILMLTFCSYSISPPEAKLCLSPLIGWEIFALMLNFCING